MLHLAEIRVYPVKSLRGAAADTTAVEPWGLAGDRRWLVTTPAGRFLTQRELPIMALIHAAATTDGLRLTAPGGMQLDIAVPNGAEVIVTIWRDSVAAKDAGDPSAGFLSHVLGLPCRLVYLADPRARKLNPDYALGDEPVSFADGFPVLITNTASLADLNARLAAPIEMLRFRPNLVISGAPAWAEDSWRRIRIGPVVLRIDKPCERCVITTIDPLTGTRPNPVEPIRTLGQFRRDARGSVTFGDGRGGVTFGQNAVPESLGTIRVTDPVEILQTRPQAQPFDV